MPDRYAQQHTFEPRLADGRVVEWDGTDGPEAARRYVECFKDAVVVAWRWPKYVIGIGYKEILG
jgi:hypothetical protein